MPVLLGSCGGRSRCRENSFLGGSEVEGHRYGRLDESFNARGNLTFESTFIKLFEATI